MALPVSPLAPKTFAEPPAVAGVRFATAEAGIKYKNRTDVLLVAFDEGTVVAGVLTRSKCPSARGRLVPRQPAGRQGPGAARQFGQRQCLHRHEGPVVGQGLGRVSPPPRVGCAESEVFLASTGVIGEPLDPEKFEGVTKDMAGRLKPLPWMDAAKAIMTTDTYPKLATATVDFDGVPVVIAGIAKGSGMIAPDMATMLSFVFTDAPIARDVLQALLRREDADELQRHHRRQRHLDLRHAASCFATGKAAIAADHLRRPIRARKVFAEALGDVLLRARDAHVVRDGEGATKLVTVTVEGAESDKSACRIAQSIANSPLVKTAIAGEDANWGRVVMAVGKAGEPADRDKLSIWFGDIRVAENGERVAELRRGRGQRLHEGRGARDPRRPRARHGHGRRSTPATSRTATSTSTAATGADLGAAGRSCHRSGRPQGLARHRGRVRWRLGPPRRQRLHQARQLGAEPRS